MVFDLFVYSISFIYNIELYIVICIYVCIHTLVYMIHIYISSVQYRYICF